MAASVATNRRIKMSDEKKLITVYKLSGKSMKVNKDMLPHLESLNLSKEKPKG